MKELSLNILDIAMNSVKAGASQISIELEELQNWLTITIRDNGCGMSRATVERLSDPFYTTRTTRNVGLGVPFYCLAAEQTGGSISIDSVPEPDPGHGTVITARFYTDHIDFTPLGDIISTVTTLIHGYPDIDLDFTHRTAQGEVSLSTRQIKDMLGDIPINSLEILNWIRDFLEEQYDHQSQKEG